MAELHARHQRSRHPVRRLRAAQPAWRSRGSRLKPAAASAGRRSPARRADRNARRRGVRRGDRSIGAAGRRGLLGAVVRPVPHGGAGAGAGRGRRTPGAISILKVNTDAVPELGERFGIRSIPTMAVFDGGREAGRTAGRPSGGRYRGIYTIDARLADNLCRMADRVAVQSRPSVRGAIRARSCSSAIRSPPRRPGARSA